MKTQPIDLSLIKPGMNANLRAEICGQIRADIEAQVKKRRAKIFRRIRGVLREEIPGYDRNYGTIKVRLDEALQPLRRAVNQELSIPSPEPQTTSESPRS